MSVLRIMLCVLVLVTARVSLAQAPAEAPKSKVLGAGAPAGSVEGVVLGSGAVLPPAANFATAPRGVAFDICPPVFE